MAVEPGTYSLYGRMALGQNGTTIGTCLCMGSVKFQAKAGQIVDLGMLHYPAAEASKEERNGHVRLASHALTPFDSSMSVPARLAGLPVVPADLRAADKMPNYFGIMIDRLPAIPGVLAYQRDKVIDVKAGGAEATTGH
jgi:hypothetical protein